MLRVARGVGVIDNLRPRCLHLRAVIERRIECASSLWRQIKDIPDRNVFVDATLLDVVVQSWMNTVEMAERAVTVASEN